ncbi:MAG: hypothetical protein WD825_10365 [Gemmatimonadaceae bacterium]
MRESLKEAGNETCGAQDAGLIRAQGFCHLTRGVALRGRRHIVVVPAFDGEVAILTDHAPMMTLLGKGELKIDAGAKRFLQVVANQVRVVTEKGNAV